MILQYSIIILITQITFIGCRTWNIKAISENNLTKALISGILVHLSWLVSVAIGSVSMYEILNDFNWEYLPIIICSTTGGLIGTYLGMKEKNKDEK